MYQQRLFRVLNLTTTANREFTQMKPPLANDFHRIHTQVVLSQSYGFPLETQYTYQQILTRLLDLTTNKVGAATANREFTQNQTPLAKQFYRTRT